MATKTQTPTHTIETIDTPAPNGETAVKVTCTCKTCKGRAAIVRKTYADAENLNTHKDAATHIHNLVGMAHSNLRFAPQVKANGPWAA